MFNIREIIAENVQAQYIKHKAKNGETAPCKAIKKAFQKIKKSVSNDSIYLIPHSINELNFGYVNQALVFKEMYCGAVDGLMRATSLETLDPHFAVAMFFVEEFNWIEEIVSSNFKNFEFNDPDQ